MFLQSWLPVGWLAAVPLAAACSIELTPAAVIGDTSVNGSVKLSQPAPASGLTFTLVSSTPSAQVSAHITVPPGESKAIFTIATRPVAASTNAVITAGGPCTAAAGITVFPASLAGLSLSETTSRANAGLRGAVTLTGPAPSTGAVVQLHSSDLMVTVPEFVTIPAGEISASFPLITGMPRSRNSVAVTATYGTSVQTALLNVLPGI
jgi:hypothetical protein